MKKGGMKRCEGIRGLHCCVTCLRFTTTHHILVRANEIEPNTYYGRHGWRCKNRKVKP
jgi:hypothetical protein